MAVLLLITSQSCFAFNDVILKILGGIGHPWYTVLGVTGPLILIFLLAVAHFQGGIRHHLKTKSVRILIFRSMLTMISVPLYITGLAKLNLALAITLVQTLPILNTLLSRIYLKQRIPLHVWICICIGFVGVLMILRPGMESFSIYALGILVSSFAIALNNLIVSKHRDCATALGFSLYHLVAPTALGIICMVIWGTSENIESDLHWFSASSVLIAAAILTQTIAFQTGHRSTGKLGVFYYIQLIWAFLFSYLIWKESIDGLTLVGSLLIVGAGGLILLREAKMSTSLEKNGSPEIYQK